MSSAEIDEEEERERARALALENAKNTQAEAQESGFLIGVGLSLSGAAAHKVSGSFQLTLSHSGGDLLSLRDYRVGYLASGSPAGVSTSLSGDISLKGTFSKASSPEELSGQSLAIGGSGGQVIVGGYDVGNLGNDGPHTHNVTLGLGTNNLFGNPTLPGEAYTSVEFTTGKSTSLLDVASGFSSKFIENFPWIITGSPDRMRFPGSN